MTSSAPPAGRRNAALTATLLAVPVALVAGLVAFWLLGGFSGQRAGGPVPVTAPPSGAGADAPCARLVGALPRKLAGASSRPVSDAPRRVAAWGDPPIVLRCGVARASADTSSAQQLVIEGVSWVYDSDGDETVWTTTSLSVYVEVRVPPEYRYQASTKILNPLAAPLKATVPAR